MEIEEIRRINLLHILEQGGRGYAKELSDKIECEPSYISQIKTSKKNMGSGFARDLEKACLKDKGWMDVLHHNEYSRVLLNSAGLVVDVAAPPPESNAEHYGSFEPWDSSTPLGDDEVELKFFTDVAFAAGDGHCHFNENEGPKLRFAKSTLSRAGVSPESAACVKVVGNSMEPALPEGATIGIDTANISITEGKMYAIDHDGMLRVKLLYRLPGNGLRLKSFNTAEHPDETYTADEAKHIRVLGKVFWSSVLY